MVSSFRLGHTPDGQETRTQRTERPVGALMADLFQFSNSSLLLLHRPLNSSSAADPTVFSRCAHMPAVLVFYLLLQFINMFVGIPANLAVLCLLRRARGDPSSSDVFIGHLAVLDALFCLTPPLELLSLVFLSSSSCWYVLRFFYGMKDSSPLFLSCICVDRYTAVRHPLLFSRLKDRRFRSVCAGVVWVFTLAYAAAKSVGNIPNFDKAFMVMILAAFALMLFCNVSILWALRRSAPGRDRTHPVKQRAFRTVLLILAIIVFNYLPPVALFPFQVYFSPDVFLCYIHYIAFGFMDISSSIQPLLYLSRERPRCCTGDSGSAEEPVFTVSRETNGTHSMPA